MKDENLRLRDHEKEELSFYSKATTDFEYLFPFGWGELWGVADRTDYDLKQPQRAFRQRPGILRSQETNEHYIPYVRRAFRSARTVVVLAFLCDAYDEEQLWSENGRHAAWCCICIRPWRPSRPPSCRCPKKLGDKAPARSTPMLARHFMVDYDETGSIGKRYRRQDEIGTPFCICVDFDTEATGNVTVRNRDTMQQDVVALDKLVDYINERIDF